MHVCQQACWIFLLAGLLLLVTCLSLTFTSLDGLIILPCSIIPIEHVKITLTKNADALWQLIASKTGAPKLDRKDSRFFSLKQPVSKGLRAWQNKGMYSCQVPDQMKASTISYRTWHTSLSSHQPLYQCPALHSIPLTYLLYRRKHHMSESYTKDGILSQLWYQPITWSLKRSAPYGIETCCWSNFLPSGLWNAYLWAISQPIASLTIQLRSM